MTVIFYERINTKAVYAGVNNFSENFKTPEGRYKTSPHRRSTNMRSQSTNFCRYGDLTPGICAPLINPLGEIYGTHSTSITTLWTARRLLSIYPSSARRKTDLKDRPERWIIDATCWNPGRKTLHHEVQMRLKRASDNGAKLYHMKGVFYSIMFRNTEGTNY
jgi:hypothetical protein